MAVQAIDGSLEKALQNAPNASSYLNPGGVLVSPSAESPKPSISGAKTGISFVIPKNKLSGALVPVVRNLGGKWEPSEVKKDEESKSLVPQRKTKWGGDLTQDPAVKRGRALALQTRAEQIAAQLESGQLDIDTHEATRSPSPPPIYDSNGQRTNTREGRRREQLELERREAIGDCLQLNPFYKPPSGYKPVYKEAKLYIPVKDYPGYNFIGLILGPRGNTQKRMEAETGTRIAIRGKGAVKEGKTQLEEKRRFAVTVLRLFYFAIKKSNAARLQGWRRDSKEAEGAFEDLHVHITADSVEKVDAAVALVEPLLTPVDEDRNTHKRKQLRELAEMNGTMRDFSKACGVCGEMGHREWHCPRDKLITFQAKFDCQICRDGGHPSVDCPRKQNGQGKVLDKEYLSFLEELGDGFAGPTSVTTSWLSMKLGSEDSNQSTNNQPNPITTPLHEVDRVSHPDTSLDPNQLVDVVSRPHTSITALNQPEHIPTAWPPGHPFINSCEKRTSLQQGGCAQIEVESPFSGMLQRNQSHFGLNVNSDPFPHTGFSHGFLPPTNQGCPSAVMSLIREGLPAPPIFHTVPDWVPANRSHFYGDSEAGPGSLTYAMPPPNGGHLRPGQMLAFNTATPESSRPQPIPWSRTRSSQPIGTANATVIWEGNQVPRQTAWTRGLPTQLPQSAWQMAREQGWKEEPPAMLPHSLGPSAAPLWKVPRKPWEASSPCNASCLSTGFNQPCQLSQRRPMQYKMSHPSPPIPSSGTFVWRGGPAPQSVRMPLPIQSESMPPPPPLPSFPYQQHPFPPSHSQPIPESNKNLNDPVLSQVNQSRSSFTPQPLPPDTLGLQRADDLCTPHSHPSPPESSNTEKDESQSQVEAAFTSSSGVAYDSPSSLDKQSQEVQLDGSPEKSFAAPNTCVTGSPVEVDAEYERLMASVGVT